MNTAKRFTELLFFACLLATGIVAHRRIDTLEKTVRSQEKALVDLELRELLHRANARVLTATSTNVWIITTNQWFETNLDSRVHWKPTNILELGPRL